MGHPSQGLTGECRRCSLLGYALLEARAEAAGATFHQALLVPTCELLLAGDGGCRPRHLPLTGIGATEPCVYPLHCHRIVPCCVSHLVGVS